VHAGAPSGIFNTEETRAQNVRMVPSHVSIG
jgi:hypothetical protein